MRLSVNVGRSSGWTLLALGIAAAVCAGIARTQETADDAGAALYVANGCWQCHGYEGQGGEAVRIAPSAYPFEAFLQFVRRPANVMPAYSSEALSDDDLRQVYAYVQARPQPAPVEQIPLLN
jgi:mono/diheme cytochrome c family protein